MCVASLWHPVVAQEKKFPSHRCLEAEEEEQQGRARSSCASLSDKSRRDSKRHFSAIYDFICVQNAPNADKGSLGTAWEAQGDTEPRIGDKCAQKWGQGGFEALPHRMGTCKGSTGSSADCPWAEEVREGIT